MLGAHGTHTQGRKRLRVAMSCDGADSWVNVAEIEAGHYKYYFHYPTLVQDKHRYVPPLSALSLWLVARGAPPYGVCTPLSLQLGGGYVAVLCVRIGCVHCLAR